MSAEDSFHDMWLKEMTCLQKGIFSLCVLGKLVLLWSQMSDFSANWCLGHQSPRQHKWGPPSILACKPCTGPAFHSSYLKPWWPLCISESRCLRSLEKQYGPYTTYNAIRQQNQGGHPHNQIHSQFCSPTMTIRDQVQSINTKSVFPWVPGRT